MLNTSHLDPLFVAWARRFGYVPMPCTAGTHQYEKYARYFLAWQANVAPDCKRAHAMVRCSGLLT
jgi:hypothetical protein